MKERGLLQRGVDRSDFKKYFFWVVVAVLVLLSYLILRPYFIALISAFVLAYLVRPVHRALKGKLGNRFAAFVSIVLVVLVLVLPLGLVVGEIVQQSYTYVAGDGLGRLLGSASGLFSSGNVDLEYLGDKVVSFVAGLLSSAAVSIPSMLISLIITLFGIYYILIEWESLSEKLKKHLPFGNQEKVSRDISKVTNILVYGTLFTGLIEFVVAALGFYVAGVKFYFLLAALVFLFAFIPGGPTVVWVPLLIYTVVVKDYFSAGVVLVTGILLSLGIDILLRGKMLGKGAKLNPLLMIVGILGGVGVFGVFGFVIGPLVLIYTIELLEEGLRKG